MKQKTFSDTDPFHVNAHLMFGFACQNCEAELGPEDIAGADLNEGFLQYCVDISTLARLQGWVSIEEFKFFCPKCSEAHNKKLHPIASAPAE